MRHRKSFNHLGRTSAHRKAMLANMASSLILHKRINTTLAKAKALRGYVEPLITRSKDDTTNSRRLVFSYLQNKEAVSALFRDIAQKVATRPGGYTRILKTGARLGDNAEMCLIELVDYNETYITEKKEIREKASRRRRGTGKSKSDEDQGAKPKAAPKDHEPVFVPEAHVIEEPEAIEHAVVTNAVDEQSGAVEEAEGTTEHPSESNENIEEENKA
jgi:large subunit ribosomal protein L17